MTPIRIAILDMYCNHSNQGMRCIKGIIDEQVYPLVWEVYDVRAKNEVPDLNYDVYFFSGGPGNPVENGKRWNNSFLRLIDAIFEHNERTSERKKFAFFICHSFQMLCNHYNLAEVCLRNSPAFGIFPVHKTADLSADPVFSHLPDPFYAVDSRDWQIISPDDEKLRKMGAEIIALEKIRPHVPYERAVMAIRFSNEIIGTQFHPEADVMGMEFYFKREEKKKQIIENHGEEKYSNMIASLKDEDKILHTHKTIIPGFLKEAVRTLRQPA